MKNKVLLALTLSSFFSSFAGSAVMCAPLPPAAPKPFGAPQEIIVWNKTEKPVYKIRLKGRFSTINGRTAPGSIIVPVLSEGQSCRIVLNPDVAIVHCSHEPECRPVKKHLKEFNEQERVVAKRVNPEYDIIGDYYLTTHFDAQAEDIDAQLLKLRVDAQPREEVSDGPDGTIVDKAPLYAAGLLARQINLRNRHVYYVKENDNGIEIKKGPRY